MSNTPTEPSTGRQMTETIAADHTSTSRDVVVASPDRSAEAVLLDTEHGKTVIADTVIAKIAAEATREITGVHDLVATGIGATISGYAGRMAKADQRATGVSVEVGRREAAVDLNMVVDYGVNVPQVAEAVRENIMDRIQAITGLIVKEVNVSVVDLYFPGEEVVQSRVQ